MHQNQPPTPKSDRTWIFLRRRIGERIAIFDSRSEAWIKVIDLDHDERSATLEIDGLDSPVTINPYSQEIVFFQGDAAVFCKEVHELHTTNRKGELRDSSFVSLGIRAARNMKILREELIRGMTREERAALS